MKSSPFQFNGNTGGLSRTPDSALQSNWKEYQVSTLASGRAYNTLQLEVLTRGRRVPAAGQFKLIEVKVFQ